MRNGSIEGIELKCPVLIADRGLRKDSCGAGKFRGGLGLDVRVRNLVEGRWNFEHTKREKCPPWGLWDGKPGEFGGYLMRLPGQEDFKPMRGSHVSVPVGSEAIVRTGGGGGWGNPLERPPELVLHDVVEELISPEVALRDYGVVLTGKGEIDLEATKRQRAAMAS